MNERCSTCTEQDSAIFCEAIRAAVIRAGDRLPIYPVDPEKRAANLRRFCVKAAKGLIGSGCNLTAEELLRQLGASVGIEGQAASTEEQL